MKEVGYGDGYVYAHDTEDAVGGLDCLPESLRGTRFYEPTDRGVEARIGERMREVERLREKARKEIPGLKPRAIKGKPPEGG